MSKQVLTFVLILLASDVGAGEHWNLGLELSFYGGLTAEYHVSAAHRVSVNYLQFEDSFGSERRYGVRWHFLNGEGPHKLELTAGPQYVGRWEQYSDVLEYEKSGPHLVISAGYRFEPIDGGWTGRMGVMFTGEADGLAVLIPWPYASAGYSF